jgi:hypothetical protein
MKNLKQIVSSLMLFTASLVFFANCSKTTTDPVQILDPATGTSQIRFLNFPGTGDVTVNAAPGDIIAVAVEVTKTDNNTQKLRVWETDVVNTRGTPSGSTIDLRSVSTPQVKNFNYTVPAGTGAKYLYFEVDETNNKYARKLLIINRGGNATIGSWSDLVLGAQTNSLGSRVSSASGQVFTACDAVANISEIDITYSSIGSLTAVPTISSNPGRKDLGLSYDVPQGCGTATAASTEGGPSTTFASAPVSVANTFDTINDAGLNALTLTGSASSIKVSEGDVVIFQTTGGRKGLIKVNSFPNGKGTDGSINISLKVQR